MDSNYDVYGIGNALVDIEVKVDDDFLKNMNIEKGLMSLVDKKRQDSLLNSFNSFDKRTCGGSAANSMIGMAQLGGKCFYSCKVSNDEMGTFFYNDLIKTGVDTNLIPSSLPEGTTGRCLVLVTPDAERTMESYLGITESFSEDELNFDRLKKSKYLYIEGYLVTSDTGRHAAVMARKFAEDNKISVALTLSDPAMPKYFGDGLKEIIGDRGVDLLFCNEEEACLFTKQNDLDSAINDLSKYAKNIVITRGERGAIVSWEGNLIEVPAEKIVPVDTVGAGDIFAGSFLYGISKQYDPKTSCQLACRLASKLVTVHGARLDFSDVEKIKKEVLKVN